MKTNNFYLIIKAEFAIFLLAIGLKFGYENFVSSHPVGGCSTGYQYNQFQLSHEPILKKGFLFGTGIGKKRKANLAKLDDAKHQ